MSQFTLDGKIIDLKNHKHQNICENRHCRRTKQSEKFCLDHELERILDIGYGLNEFIIPQEFGITAHDYFKNIRRSKFESDKAKLLIQVENYYSIFSKICFISSIVCHR